MCNVLPAFETEISKFRIIENNHTEEKTLCVPDLTVPKDKNINYVFLNIYNHTFSNSIKFSNLINSILILSFFYIVNIILETDDLIWINFVALH